MAKKLSSWDACFRHGYAPNWIDMSTSTNAQVEQFLLRMWLYGITEPLYEFVIAFGIMPFMLLHPSNPNYKNLWDWSFSHNSFSHAVVCHALHEKVCGDNFPIRHYSSRFKQRKENQIEQGLKRLYQKDLEDVLNKKVHDQRFFTINELKLDIVRKEGDVNNYI